MQALVYNATGQVIDSETSQGIPGVRIEAWDVDMKTHTPLAVANTTNKGRFVLRLNFERGGFQSVPDVIFKVYRNGFLLETMESSLSWNANTEEDVTISVLKTPKVRKEVKDRITAKQFVVWADFFQKSDFIGAFQNVKDKAGNIFNLIPDTLLNTFANLDPKPVSVSGRTENEVINQDVNTVKQDMESNNIAVEILPYNPRFNKTFFADISTLSANIQPGQKVNLYQENGTVKYYTVVKERKTLDTSAPLPAAAVTDHKAEIDKLNEALRAAKEDTKRKDEQIAKLQNDISEVSRQQVELQKVFDSGGFKNLLKSMEKTAREVKKDEVVKTGKIVKPGK